MPIAYTRKQITQWLGNRTILKAMDYLHDVSDLHWDGPTLHGRVQGTEFAPYETEIRFFDVSPSRLREATCSCPVGIRCKHAAALLLVNLQSPAKTSHGVRPELLRWLEGFRSQLVPTSKPKQASSRPTHSLLYAFCTDIDQAPGVCMFKARLNPAGKVQSLGSVWNNIDAALTRSMKFITEDDLPILRAFRQIHPDSYYDHFPLSGIEGATVIERILATGRAFAFEKNSDGMYYGIDNKTYTFGNINTAPARPASVTWQADDKNRIKPVLQVDPPATLLFMTQPCWYVDTTRGEAGIIDSSCPATLLAAFLSMPPVSSSELGVVAAVMQEVAPELPLPTSDDTQVPTVDITPTPVLYLETRPIAVYHGDFDVDNKRLDFATLHFDYAGVRLEAGSTRSLARNAQDETVYVKRRPEDEQKAAKMLKQIGLRKIPRNNLFGHRVPDSDVLSLRTASDWPAFMQAAVPELRRQGWQVEMSADFSQNVIVIDDIDGSIQQSDNDWFDLDMGIVVNDRKVSLVPLLTTLFQRDERWLSGQLESIGDDEMIELRTPNNERLRMQAARIKPIMRVLIDLFEGLGSGENLRVSTLDLGRLQALHDTGRWQFHGDSAIQALAKRLLAGPGVHDVAPPTGLKAHLRPYQQQGLNWMQFLRTHDLAGVLADDMGLGKTVQTLAHILCEKEAGRLDRPALVVMPTSLMHNWCEEAQRFAPALRVLDLHGPQRQENFGRISEHDLVLTTYPLLWRDEEALTKTDYHLLILDEAQYVKNATSQASAVIRKFKTRHRLCLTGTPLENHLGELWSQFDFLLPGLLGSQRDFTQRWRTPIEKNGDTVRRELLARRIRSFVLRRRKDEVAQELPPKTIVTINVELEGAQRDLYESVRSAMQKKVRDAIAANGFARSHIIVLEALLKLRQVCCDPRLVKTPSAGKIKQSAKLETLMDMLPPMIEEGRRILLFSQFTSMLGLIATALDAQAIPYAMLTGDTINRAAVIKRFNSGKVPVFLISLKAGGVGLNLTTADTVIHYDPWWNPAVENQATDRAHRIGQDKPVFVYKLVTTASIEEKIVVMQEKKAALAEAVLTKDSGNVAKFSAEDIEALFEST
ncbi:helicase [Dyella sp. M7H15-1]|uniref:DEAD/DEAH box helicase n=1 Tax=Dyella sp. M7H15-1 TaxID=2501295 RepID=UPI001004FF1E|nr:DEAD/DEAH box helicase [Dyella sp. M7H15-1]QAU23816.1 helicase [Dyella sp. M7H15-1]